MSEIEKMNNNDTVHQLQVTTPDTSSHIIMRNNDGSVLCHNPSTGRNYTIMVPDVIMKKIRDKFNTTKMFLSSFYSFKKGGAKVEGINITAIRAIADIIQNIDLSKSSELPDEKGMVKIVVRGINNNNGMMREEVEYVSNRVERNVWKDGKMAGKEVINDPDAQRDKINAFKGKVERKVLERLIGDEYIEEALSVLRSHKPKEESILSFDAILSELKKENSAIKEHHLFTALSNSGLPSSRSNLDSRIFLMRQLIGVKSGENNSEKAFGVSKQEMKAVKDVAKKDAHKATQKKKNVEDVI